MRNNFKNLYNKLKPLSFLLVAVSLILTGQQLLPPGQVLGASTGTQTVLDTDSFTGTNGTTLPAYNTNWSQWGSNSFNNCLIQSTPGIGSSSCGNSRGGQTWTNDQWAELTVTSLTSLSDFGACVRTTSPSNQADGYCGGIDGHFNNLYRIMRYTNAIPTALATSVTAIATNDVVNLQIVGTTLTLTVNGTVLLTATDSTYSTGSPGLHVASTNTTNSANSWRAGSVSQTVDTTPPVISNIASSGITQSAATISWTTDISSNSQVDYGTTTSYGSSSALNSTLTTSHSVSLSGLTASTLYHYRVKSSSNGNLAISADNTFTTTAPAPADTTAPTVPSGLSATAVSSSAINLTWTASTDDVAVTGYTIYRGGVQIGTTASTNYSDTGLTASTDYSYTIDAFDAAGNHSAQSSSASATTQSQSTTTNCSAASIRCVGPGQQYTTIQACATAMQAGDTCVVFAGTYNENVNVPAGAVGAYKTLTVNGSDVVTVNGFTLNSHTKLIGNCVTVPATVGSCGFNIQNPSAPSSNACVAMPNNTTDVYIKNNVMYACGSTAMIAAGYPETVSYIYVQGNTLSYACVTQATAGPSKECNGIYLEGNHVLVEKNDLSHYTLGIYVSVSYGVFRNNTLHDQYETEAGGNAHTDAWFSQPGVSKFPVEYNLYEGNYQYNGFGPDAKGTLTQGGYCGGVCFNFIDRFNTVSRLGGGYGSNNDPSPYWPYVKRYNNTFVDVNADEAEVKPDTNNDAAGGSDNTGGPYASELNQIFYYRNTSGSTINGGPVVPYASNSTDATVGYNLAYCPTCSQILNQYNGSTFTNTTGNKIADPQFVSYVSSGSLSNDYHLRAGSPAIGAGTNLTTVAAGDSGSGTSLVVNDASYFQDGYGLTNAGVQPDWIAVGAPTNVAQISSINYSTNTITLATPLSRSVGAAVYLYKNSSGAIVLTGSSPDIGAYPYTGAGSPPPTDTTAPSAPSSVTASAISSSAINLSWSASTDVDDASSAITYKVFRNGTQIGTTAAGVMSYSDTGLSAGTTYSYTISASDPAGNSSAQSSPAASATTQSNPDTTAPTVAILNPSSGSFAGTITVSVSAQDPTVSGQTTSGLALVTISIDGTVFATSTSGTLSKSLDTTTLTNSSHTITAIAKDNAGNTSTTATVTITVNNATATKYPRLVTLTSLEGLSSIPAGTTITATILSPSNGATLETQSNLTATSGNYTVSFLSTDPQLVNIRITVSGYLSQLLTNIDTTVNSSVALSVPQLLAGDLNSDNTINSLDYSLMNSHFLQNFSQADINRDGLVNSLDYAILKNNYGKSGQ